MKALAGLLIVLGVCVGALGASGFHTPIEAADAEAPPSTESNAWLLFLAGVVLLGAGGGLARAGRTKADSEDGHASVLQGIRDEVAALRDTVVALQEGVEDPPSEPLRTDEEALRTRLDDLLSGPYFDLTSKSDDVIALLGFDAYARVWEGVANAERLLARAWSMSSDGHHEEGLEELPIARANLDRAVEELDRL